LLGNLALKIKRHIFAAAIQNRNQMVEVEKTFFEFLEETKDKVKYSK
jgi:hypothetical protein